MSATEKVRAIAYGGFMLFVAIPLLFQAMSLLNSPNATTSEAMGLIESTATPWWLGIAETAPFVFVAVIGLLVWAGGEDIL